MISIEVFILLKKTSKEHNPFGKRYKSYINNFQSSKYATVASHVCSFLNLFQSSYGRDMLAKQITKIHSFRLFIILYVNIFCLIVKFENQDVRFIFRLSTLEN